MKACRTSLLLLAAALLAAPALASPAPAIGPDHGQFRILLRGRSVGTEDFTIAREGEGWSARSSIRLHLPGRKEEQDTAALSLGAHGSPIRYRWTGHSARVRSIQVAFSGHAARVTLRQPGSAPAVEAFSFPPGPVVVLDNNVYAQYAILARLYNWKAGGPQKFSVLIPQDQVPGTVTVESRGKRRVAGTTLDLLAVKSPDLEVDLYVDAARRPMILRVPGSGAEIVRQ
ncbi:MAG TPA: hypothetical protein VNJ52_01300 [Patescibacteria group bacterium]|nr:hypothetical protein [Patescibacteria group bacterium]